MKVPSFFRFRTFCVPYTDIMTESSQFFWSFKKHFGPWSEYHRKKQGIYQTFAHWGLFRR